MAEPVQVTSRYLPGGEVVPIQFCWNDAQFFVESTGRRWKDEAGTHILVMIKFGRVVELILDADHQWWLCKIKDGGDFLGI